jgi:F-type H+-transporting ATPase subunit b
MRGVKKFAGILSLATLALWFSLSLGTAFASGEAQAPAVDSHTVVTDNGGHDTAAVTEGHEGAGGAVHSSSLSATKIKDLGWRVVNFIALMIILVKFGAKPIGSGLAARQAQIKDEIEELQKKRVEAEQSYNDFQTKLANVESEIDTVVERAVAQAEIEKKKIIEKAEQAAEDIKRAAEMAIQNEITEARRQLKDEVADQAAVMAEELIVKNLTDDDQVKIIEDYLAKVGAVQ